MANVVSIAGLKFRLLNTDEAREHTADCRHEFVPLDKEVVVNPAREFVEGHGSHFVAVRIAQGRICKKCGFFEPVGEVERAIKSGKLQHILRHPSRQRTICQLLRELHKSVVSGDDQRKVDQCLLIAKKMNDKLVGYCGVGYAKDWYGEDGEYVEE